VATGDDPPAEQAETNEAGRRAYLVADVEPLDVDGTRTVAVGAGLWLVAFVLLLPFHAQLRAAEREWWLWTCLAGFALGVLGWAYCRRRRNRRRRSLARHQTRGLPPGVG
jgi:hypothetical protein